MKKFVYQLFYSRDPSDEDKRIDFTCGFFSSLVEIRNYILKDESPKENYSAYRFNLNPEVEEDVCGKEVAIIWEKNK